MCDFLVNCSLKFQKVQKGSLLICSHPLPLCISTNIRTHTVSKLCSGEHIRSGDKAPETAPRSLLLKPGQSGLRPPGFSSLPARLTTFGFARSSSASSVSSNQSNDSGHSDHCQLARGESPVVIQIFRRSAVRCQVL